MVSGGLYGWWKLLMVDVVMFMWDVDVNGGLNEWGRWWCLNCDDLYGVYVKEDVSDCVICMVFWIMVMKGLW
jgi:hypothetical protein